RLQRRTLASGPGRGNVLLVARALLHLLLALGRPALVLGALALEIRVLRTGRHEPRRAGTRGPVALGTRRRIASLHAGGQRCRGYESRCKEDGHAACLAAATGAASATRTASTSATGTRTTSARATRARTGSGAAAARARSTVAGSAHAGARPAGNRGLPARSRARGTRPGARLARALAVLVAVQVALGRARARRRARSARSRACYRSRPLRL